MKKIYFISLIIFCQSILNATTIDTLIDRKNLIFLTGSGVEKTVYKAGDALIVKYYIPSDILRLLEQADLHLVVSFPSGESFDTLLNISVANQLTPFLQFPDTKKLSLGEYYFSLILTKKGKGALKVKNWFKGTFGRIDWQRIKVVNEDDPEDLNKDGYIDNDYNGDGLAEIPLGQSYNEDPIKFNQHLFQLNDQLEITYNLSNRLNQVFSGLANAFMVATFPDERIAVIPLPAINPDQNNFLLTLTSLSNLVEGNYLVSLVFTRPGGDPLLLNDWMQNITPINHIDRVFINKTAQTNPRKNLQKQVNGDGSDNGLNDTPILEKRIAALCNNNNDCLHNELPRVFSLSTQQLALIDLLCGNNSVCIASLHDPYYQFNIDTADFLLKLVCPNSKDSCLAKKTASAVEFIENKIVVRHIANDLLCPTMSNTECNNFLIPLYDQLVKSLLNRVCTADICGTNGNFFELVKSETKFQKLVVDICQYDFTCEDNLFGNPQLSESELTTLICTDSTVTNCTDLMALYTANDKNYFILVTSICGKSEVCGELMSITASFSSALLDRQKGMIDFCAGNQACLKDDARAILKTRIDLNDGLDVIFEQIEMACIFVSTAEELASCENFFFANGFFFDNVDTEDTGLLDSDPFDISELTDFDLIDIETF